MMTRETKFGLLFVLVLTGVFGMLVYKRMHQPADLVAGTNEEQEVLTETPENSETKAPTSPTPLLATNTKDDAEPFDLSPPVKPSTPARPETRTPTTTTAPGLADFETDLAAKPVTPAKPKLPTSVPDDDFFTPPATTTTARSAAVPTASADPFGDDAGLTTKPAATTAIAPKPAVTDSSTTALPKPEAAPFDPFADPLPAAEATMAQPSNPPAATSTVSADPFADAPAQVDTPAAKPAVAAMPAESLPLDEDPFMAPATSSAPAAEIVETQPPALDFDSPAQPVATEATAIPDLGFDDTPVTVQPAKPVATTPAAVPADPFDDPFATTPEVKVTTRATTPLPTPVEELPVDKGEMATQPSLPTAVPEVKTAELPESSRPVDFPEPELPKVATATPALMPADEFPTSAPPRAAISEPDPFGTPEKESEFSAAPPLAAPARPAPVAPRTLSNSGTYEVQLTDSFWTISKQVYGTGRYYQALAKHNAATVSDPLKLKPGSFVETPAAEVLEARYRAEIPLTAAGTTNSATDEAESGFFVDANGKAMYRVGSNDTLSSISKAHLGRASRWIQIFEMNRQILKDGNTLKVGTELQLPADASQVQMVDFQQPGR